MSLLFLRGEGGLTTRLRSALASSFVRAGWSAPPAPLGDAFDHWRGGEPLARLFPAPEAAAWVVRF
jgi:hypothetical protein